MNSDMFSFLTQDSYADRCVAVNNFDWGFISTAMVADGKEPFETAIQHNEYSTSLSPHNMDSMLIVESYQTQELAASGHKRWMETMARKDLPAELIECHNAGIAELVQAAGGNLNQIHREGERKSSK